MAVPAAIDPLEYEHFLGDISALFLVAIVLGVLMPPHGPIKYQHGSGYIRPILSYLHCEGQILCG